MRELVILLALTVGFAACGAEEEKMAGNGEIDAMKARLAKYAQVEVSSNVPGLSAEEEVVLQKLIEAAEIMDEIFWAQASSDGLEWRAKLEASDSELDKLKLHFLRINSGGFDRQAENEPFLGTEPKPAGATFWPEDLTRGELESYVEAHPEQKEELYSLTTVVRRDGNMLKAIPYRELHRDQLEQAANLVREAAAESDNPGFANYLQLRADALVSDDYYESDMAWMDLAGSKFDIVIGAIEPYEDGLMNLKGSYEAFVLVKDEAASAELGAYIDLMEEMQQALPVDEKFKRRQVRLGSSVGVFTMVRSAGDGDAGIKTIAISLPNDERVRAEKGARKIMLRNAIDAKFRMILMPIAERLLAPEQAPLVDGDLFFSDVLLHEVSHSLGNDFVLEADGNPTELKIDVALKNHSSSIEECKADVSGLYSADVMISRGVISEEQRHSLYTTYLAGIFRSVRFGATSAHGIANAIELNWMLEKGGITTNDDGRWAVDVDKFRSALEELCAELLTIQYTGDYERADAMVGKYGELPEQLAGQLAALSDIPVDIEFVWK